MLSSFIKPKSLHPGDKIAAISLSWGGAGSFPHRYQKGKQRLQDLFDVEVVETRHALCDAEWLYHHPEARAEDFMEAFRDPSIKAIFSIIGGDDSLRLLPFIDYEVIRRHPKIFLGYSDSTVSHFICLKAGLRSFYGPAVMTAFAENVAMHRYTLDSVRHTLFSNATIGEIPPNREGWTTEYSEWGKLDAQEKQRMLYPPLPWRFISGSGKAQGRLIGGCAEVLQFINGTEIWPALTLWEGAILFIETSEEGISPTALERILRNLGAQGILARLQGLLFSKPGGATLRLEEFVLYDKAILKVLTEYDRTDLIVVTHMDFGHSDPMMVIPFGALAEIDVSTRKICILESGVL